MLSNALTGRSASLLFLLRLAGGGRRHCALLLGEEHFPPFSPSTSSSSLRYNGKGQGGREREGKEGQQQFSKLIMAMGAILRVQVACQIRTTDKESIATRHSNGSRTGPRTNAKLWFARLANQGLRTANHQVIKYQDNFAKKNLCTSVQISDRKKTQPDEK